MSNLIDNAYTQLNNLTQINADDIQTESINTQKITANEVNAVQVYSTNLNLTGSIINGSNSITFNEQYEFMDIPKNMHIYGTGFIDYQGTTYNIGEIIASFVGTGTVSPYPSITYNSTTGETTFTGALVFPSQSISSASINNIDFLTLGTTQTVDGVKTFSGTQIFSSIQLNSDLLVNNGGTTLPNSTLSKIQYISGLTSDLNTRLNTDETNITTLQTKTTGLTYSGTTSTISNTLESSIFTFSTSINGATKSVFDNTMLYCNSLTGNVQTAINSANTNITTLQTKTQYISSTSLNTTITNTTNLTDVFFSTSINGATKLVFDNTMLYCNSLTGNVQTAINSVNSNITTNTNDISTLNTKTQYISSTSLNTTITNTTNLTDVVFSGNLNTLPASYFTGITSNIQTQINDAVGKANSAQSSATNAIDKASTAQSRADSAYNLASAAQGTASTALALAGTANGLALTANGLAATANTSANTANSVNTTQQTAIDQNITDITTLQAKTFSISRNATTNITTIAGTLTSATIRLTSLDSGLNQLTTDAITFAGYTTINNTLYLGNYNSLIADGIINQTSTNLENGDLSNQLKANTNISGIATLSGTSTTISSASVQIGVNSTNTFNCNSSASFGGDVSLIAAKNLRLKNIVPILFDDIIFGDSVTNSTDDVIFNMQMVANRPVTLNNTFQQGTTLNRFSSTNYTTTSLIDANTGMTLTAPSIFITTPLITIGQAGVTSITLNGSNVYIGQLLGTNYLYGTTYVQKLYSATGVVDAVGQVFQQW